MYNIADIYNRIKTEKHGDCIICVSHKAKIEGYTAIQYKNSKELLHRLLYRAHNPNSNIDNLLIRHTCNNRQCININHLIPGTPQDNVDDMVRADRQAKGEQNGYSKLKDHEVIEIYFSSESNRTLGKIYNVSHTTIRYIKNKVTWKHITKNL